MGSSMSGEGRRKTEMSVQAFDATRISAIAKESRGEEERLTGVIHVSEEPLHRSLSIGVSSREQCSLTSNSRESHAFEHVHRSLIELGKTWSSCWSRPKKRVSMCLRRTKETRTRRRQNSKRTWFRVLRKSDLSLLESSSEPAIESKDVSDFDGDV